MTILRRARRVTALVAATATTLAMGVLGIGAAPPASSAPVLSAGSQWIDVWGASPQPGDPGIPGMPSATPFANQTLRLIVHPHAGGSVTRIRLSNDFGTQSVVIGHVSIANQTSGAAVSPTSVRLATFLGAESVTIPAGGETTSDPIPFTVTAGHNVAVDIYLPQSTGVPTGHLDAQQTSYVSTAGDHDGEAALPVASSIPSWFFLTDIQTVSVGGTGVVAFGDSITDGTNSTVDANHRWPDYLATDLASQHKSSRLAVIDEGIGGGRLIYDVIGPSGLSRFDRDVLAKPSVHYVIVLIGINDIGVASLLDPSQAVTSAQIIQGYQQLISDAHAHGLAIYGGTLSPVGGSIYDNPTNEQERQQVNAWLRSTAGASGGFDKLVDFDTVLRDPSDPSRLLPAFDSGDHIHPDDSGYAAAATAAAQLFS
jgi:lysophospholipase L1-like esterase